jgi:hypothetical protein
LFCCTDAGGSPSGSCGITDGGHGRKQYLSSIVSEEKTIHHEAADLKVAVCGDFFEFKKFIQADEELDLGQNIQRWLCEDQKILREYIPTYWKRHRQSVKNILDNRRANAGQSLGVVVKGK